MLTFNEWFVAREANDIQALKSLGLKPDQMQISAPPESFAIGQSAGEPDWKALEGDEEFKRLYDLYMAQNNYQMIKITPKEARRLAYFNHSKNNSWKSAGKLTGRGMSHLRGNRGEEYPTLKDPDWHDDMSSFDARMSQANSRR